MQAAVLQGDQVVLSIARTEWEVEGTAGTEYGLGFAISTFGKRRVLGD